MASCSTHARSRSAPRNDWNTPASVVEAIAAMGPVDLDPCSNSRSLVAAGASLAAERGEDGLAQPWCGLVYVNPPYGRGLIRPWVEKAAASGCEVVMLLPAHTGTSWFQILWERATALCFVRGRLRFVGAPSPAPFASVLAYFGHRPALFRLAMADLGHVLELRAPQG